jgi:hypothetical protein
VNRSEPPDTEAPVDILLNMSQRDLLLKEIAVPEHLLRLIRLAPMKKGLFLIRLTMEQLDELLDCLEDKASETSNKKLRKEIYDLCEAMEQVGLRRILETEMSRVGFDDPGVEYDLSDEASPEPRSAWNGSSRERVFSPEGMNDPPLPSEFNEMFVKFLQHQARIPRADMAGLSWDQMIQIVRADWDDDYGPIRFNRALKLKDLQGVEMLGRARTFLQAVSQAGGVKATAAQNLNRKFVSLMVESLNWPEGYVDQLHIMNKVLNEQDVFPLHVVRLLLDLSGLLTLRKGVFTVSKKGERALKEDQSGTLYQLLFNAMFKKFNLAYLDRMPPVPSFQETISYSLFLLAGMKKRWMRTDELAPKILLEPVRLEMENTRIPIHWFVSSRLFRPLREFGLLEQRELPDQHKTTGVEEVRKTGLFDEFVSFHRP